MSDKKNLVRCTDCKQWVKKLAEGLCPECTIERNNKAMLAARQAYPKGLKP